MTGKSVLSILMPDEDAIDYLDKTLMADLMSTLHRHGIKEVHVGAMMRLMGVDDAVAAEHDNERVELSDDFAKYINATQEPRPPDQTLH